MGWLKPLTTSLVATLLISWHPYAYQAYAQPSKTQSAEWNIGSKQHDESGEVEREPSFDDLWTPPVHHTGKFMPYEQETDEDWVDDRFAEMDTGPFFTSSIVAPDGQMVPKALALRLSQEPAISQLFDKQQLLMRCGWTDGFIEPKPRRYGLLDMPTIDGSVTWSVPSQLGWRQSDDQGWHDIPDSDLDYYGLNLDGQRTLLRYSVAGTSINEVSQVEIHDGEPFGVNRWLDVGPREQALRLPLVGLNSEINERDVLSEHSGVYRVKHAPGRVTLVFCETQDVRVVVENSVAWMELPSAATSALTHIVTTHEDEDPAQLADIGYALHELGDSFETDPQPRWGDPLETRGKRGEDTAAYVVDTIEVPFDNPFGALLFTSGIDFDPAGVCFVCTAHGDVWKVTGINEQLDAPIHWQRFATGLYQPLGLRVADGRLLVLGRDQITHLIDLNGDGEADEYRNFNDDLEVLGQPHAYAMCLESDGEGNLYFLKSGAVSTPHGGTLLKVSSDGSRLSVVASGYRHPNGLGVNDQGFITSADNEGNWVPATRIDKVEPGGFYGHMPTHHRSQPPESYDPPLCWLPRSLDNSAGGQVWVTSDRWGPLTDQLLHFSFGHCTLNLVLPQQIGSMWQGGALRFPDIQFLSGAMRGRFSPADGQLYVVGLDGWQTGAVQDGCLQRVRYTGQDWLLPVELAVVDKTIELRFSTPLDPEFCQHRARWNIEQWQYRWTKDYGSPEFKISDSELEGHDEVTIEAIEVDDGAGQLVHIHVPDLQPVMQMHIQAGLRSAEGQLIEVDIYNTVHQAD